jgi:alkanesulfonate monooxygenase SsuD/methylene tetrahydromethanopterin reductase-like flavin-dependent oxidoreductase (luciferase family)
MDLGFFTMPIHPLGKDWRQCLREDREAFILADELGFKEGYVGEHYTDAAENITHCISFLAWIAEATKNIRLGTGTVNIPNSHPVAIAGQVAMLDHMLDGRLNFGISPGGLATDAEAFGSLNEDRAAMFLEGINMVLDIWASEAPYNIQGKYWNVTTETQMLTEIGQGIMPKPLQLPHPPIVVTAVAPFSKGVTEAAARGWDCISANFLLKKWVKTHWPKYVEGCERAGRVADPANWRVARSVLVCDDMATARDYALGPQSPYRYYYSQLLTKMKKHGRANLFKADQNMSDDEVTLDDVMKECVIWGTPDKVTDQILALRDEIGDFGTLLYAGKDWTDVALGRRSMVLLAEKCLPAINDAIGKSDVAAQ